MRGANHATPSLPPPLPLCPRVLLPPFPGNLAHRPYHPTGMIASVRRTQTAHMFLRFFST